MTLHRSLRDPPSPHDEFQPLFTAPVQFQVEQP